MTRLTLLLASVAVASLAGCGDASPSATASAPSGFFNVVKGASLDARDAKTMAQGKVQTVRFLMNWPSIERSDGAYNWSSADQVVGTLAKAGIKAVPFVFGSPGWVNRKPTHPPLDSAHDRAAWRTFLQQAVKRYGPGGSYWTGKFPYPSPYHHQCGCTGPSMPIRAWQIWNEPNLENYFSPRPSAKKYAQLLKIAHGAITSQDRGATIVLAGMPGYGKPRAWKFLSQLYRISGIKRDFDATALHPYARSLSQLKAEVTRVRQVMKKHGDGNTSLWFTELGWGSGHPDKFGLNKGLKGQKRLLSQSFKLILNRRASWHVQRVFWFDWRDPGRNSNAAGTCSFCRSAGLLRHNRHPKPAWRAFKRFSAG